MSRWTPKEGALSLQTRFGRETAVALLSDLLLGCELPEGLRYTVLIEIGDDHAVRLLRSESPLNTASDYWPRAWAARSLMHHRASEAEEALTLALEDPHWRVRMNSIRALAAIGGTAFASCVNDEHPRVRAAAYNGLGLTARRGSADKVGAESALTDPRT